MSTIVVVQKQQQAVIAADSLTTFGETRQTAAMDAAPEKIFKFQDSFIGIVGSAAHQLVLESALPEIDGAALGSRAEIFETFRRLHPLLKDRYFLNPKDEDDDAYESMHIDALLINTHGLFGVFALREVFAYKHFWAIGAGSEFALGAMHALYDRLDDPLEIASAAIAASAEFSVSTALPMSYYRIDQPQTIRV